MAASLRVEGLGDLNDHHHDQVQNYLTYCRKKRDVLLKEINITFDEEEGTRLLEDDYKREEVVEIFNGLRSILKSNINNEMMVLDRCNALLVRQLFGQAESNGHDLTADLDALENHQLLAGMAKYEELLNVRGGEKTLGSIGLSGDRGIEMGNEIIKLKEENETLRDRLAKLQEQCANMMRSKTSLGEEMEQMQTKYETVMKDFEMLGLTEEQRALLLQSGSTSALADIAARQEDLANGTGAGGKAGGEHGGPYAGLYGDAGVKGGAAGGVGGAAAGGSSKELEAELDRLASMLDDKERELRDLERQLVGRVQDTAPFQNLKRMVQKKNRVIKELHHIVEELGGEAFLDRMADQDDPID